ncbi:unnamed protein product [Allacma fusca]|uniref:RWD domain-containing protein n=1 Tax=Allacma fusca TaxID=39272 RepID=A0A8J2PXZ6_9HEXA|nr:unnamed protein product [Allacma fusca]
MANEEQITEIEVLMSIYDGDPCFNKINDSTFQYRFGTDGEKTACLLEMQWPPEYPEVVPTFNFNAFYNNHLSSATKAALVKALNEQAVQNLGDPQGYTIFEWARDSLADLMTNLQNEPPVPLSLHLDSGDDDKNDNSEKALNLESSEGKSKVKKEQLTKSQKRREWSRLDAKGEKPRGYDWVDVIRHLSQTGSQALPETLPPTPASKAAVEEEILKTDFSSLTLFPTPIPWNPPQTQELMERALKTHHPESKAYGLVQALTTRTGLQSSAGSFTSPCLLSYATHPVPQCNEPQGRTNNL